MAPNKYIKLRMTQESEGQFESLIDLFTLLSFVLIIASFVFGIYQFQASDKVVEIDSNKVASRGSPITIPENIIFIAILKRNKADIVHIVKGGQASETHVTDSTNISTILGREQKDLETAKEIHLVFFIKDITHPNYKLFYDTEEYLANHGITKFKIHFQ